MRSAEGWEERLSPMPLFSGYAPGNFLPKIMAENPGWGTAGEG